MSLTTEADLKAAIAAGQLLAFQKATSSSEGAGNWTSLWRSAGRPAAGAVPPSYGVSSDFRPTKDTVGSLTYRNAGSGKELLIHAARSMKASVGTLILYDRLWACSGLVTNVTDVQSITYGGSYPVNRGAANGAWVEPWLEMYGAPGATPATWTLNFQDQLLGGVNSATYDHPANGESAGTLCPMTMAAGARSVYYPIDFTCSASSGSAGNVGITLLRPILRMSVNAANRERMLGYLETGLARVDADACLALMILSSTTSTGVVSGAFEALDS